MVLRRNPNFHGETYPSEGEPGDQAKGWLKDAGKPLPLIERAVYNLEKENIPYWNKFLQGYYDTSGITSSSFDQAVQLNIQGEAGLTPSMQAKGIGLVTAVTTSVMYFGFNMKDPVIGGDSERTRLLRRAISIALDYEEYVSIFTNGRGEVAQGILPPGVFGHRPGDYNPYVYEMQDGRPRRKPLSEAQRLMAEAGYPDGIDQGSGKPLVLNFDVPASGPDSRAQLNWLRKQFAKLGIQLMLRATDYNRFQEKMRDGSGQMYWWGWNADYPDPENFFFLLHGPQGKVEQGGENTSNYANPAFDALFDRMKSMADGPERQAIIDQMNEIVRRDAPWIWGYFPKGFSLFHSWYSNTKPNLMANNLLKYKRLDPELRAKQRLAWNRPKTWPLLIVLATVLLALGVAWRAHRQRELGRAL
jgi:ABC-type transport system substrate-binding protein